MKEYRFGDNWPVVYILEDGKEAYVGESVSVFNRANQHLINTNRSKLNNMFVIADDEYNKSATLDIESMLIKFMAGDGQYLLQNANHGILDANYYDRERYQAKFEIIWKELKNLKIVQNDLFQIENSDLFKYSPYKSLTEDQLQVVNNILDSIKEGKEQSYLISGEPGTGKTIVATFLMKALTYRNWSKNLKIGMVVPMTSLRTTLKRVFKKVKGLNPNMILGPNDVVRNTYDILIVDEAHRLQRRINLTNYRDFDLINSKLNLDKNTGTQLDWVMKSSKYQILFYDSAQSIKPADIQPNEFMKYKFISYRLVSQMRVKGGSDYIKYIKDILNSKQTQHIEIENYEFKLFENMHDLVRAIKRKDNEKGLSRLLAGYAWEWKTNGKDIIDYDFEINGVKLRWNSVTKDWVNSPNAVNEVGCIHTIQGYDLNYAGVIIGPEISYDFKLKKIIIDKSKYLDFNGKRAISDPIELETYIINIYKTLLTRGILGTYVYVVDKNLHKYFSQFFQPV